MLQKQTQLQKSHKAEHLQLSQAQQSQKSEAQKSCLGVEAAPQMRQKSGPTWRTIEVVKCLAEATEVLTTNHTSLKHFATTK